MTEFVARRDTIGSSSRLETKPELYLMVSGVDTPLAARYAWNGEDGEMSLEKSWERSKTGREFTSIREIHRRTRRI